MESKLVCAAGVLTTAAFFKLVFAAYAAAFVAASSTARLIASTSANSSFGLADSATNKQTNQIRVAFFTKQTSITILIFANICKYLVFYKAEI
jgi:hypothetical protein